MDCYSCNKQKNQLHPLQSSLMPGTTLLMCQMCIESKFEPRWVIILAGRQKGPEYVRDFIIKRKYVGREIAATELIV